MFPNACNDVLISSIITSRLKFPHNTMLIHKPQALIPNSIRICCLTGVLVVLATNHPFRHEHATLNVVMLCLMLSLQDTVYSLPNFQSSPHPTEDTQTFAAAAHALHT